MPDKAVNQELGLWVRDFRIQAIIGWPEQERAMRQELSLSMKLDFSQVPSASKTNELGDTVCYDQLCQKAAKFFASTEHRLLEHALASLIPVLLEDIDPRRFGSFRYEFALTKVSPPIEQLRGGVVCTLRGWQT